MTKFVYIGQHAQPYPHILVPNGDEAPKVLVALPGDVQEFDEPPTDGLWVQAPKGYKPPKPPELPAEGGVLEPDKGLATVGE